MELGTKVQCSLVGLVVMSICGVAWWTHRHLDVETQPEAAQRVVDKKLAHGVRLLRDDVGRLTTKVDELARELRAREGPPGLLETIDSIQLGAVEFGEGSSTIEAAEESGLVELANTLAKNPGPVLVLGLADNCGRPTRNLNLSEKRAQAVVDWFRNSGDVPVDSEIYVRGMGESLGAFGERECDDDRLRSARVVPLDSEAGRMVIAAVAAGESGRTVPD